MEPRGIEQVADKGWYASLAGRSRAIDGRVREEMLQLLGSSIRGTGREAVLSIDAWGKTGTSQQSRDAWFIGFAGDLIVGVWVGNDDNSPNPGLHGGGIPAQMWRQFMQSALGIAPVVVAEPEPVFDGNAVEDIGNDLGRIGADAIDAASDQLGELGLDIRQGEDGSISVGPRRREPDYGPPPREDRRPPDEPQEQW